MMTKSKPLGHKSYGSIPHLPGSRRGPADRGVQGKQAEIAIEKVPTKHHYVIVQEKLDGSNVGVVKINGQILALSRSGYLAKTSRFEMHHMFSDWVDQNSSKFDAVLSEGERICGEWLAFAHGTRYKVSEPFVAFDIMTKHERIVYNDFEARVSNYFQIPHILHRGNSSFSIESAIQKLGDFGFHGALEKPEGAVWRIELDRYIKNGIRRMEVLFLCKYVMPEKVDGKYFPSISGKAEVWNWRPEICQQK